MEAAASNAAGAQPLLRYWLTPGFISDGSHSTGHIRIEWTVQGVTRSTYGSFHGDSINWQYAEPPAKLDELAFECAMDAAEFAVAGASFEGQQSMREMDHDVSRLCVTCGTYAESESALSNDGECGRCFIQSMAAPSFRIMRVLANGRRVDVAHPLMPGTSGLSLRAADAEAALANARRIVNDTRNLIAIPEAA